MKSRKQEEFSSLDLLLDTICNTFGGIVFLALLLSIIAQSAGEMSRAPEMASLPTLERSLQDLQEDVKDAEGEVNRLKTLITESENIPLPPEVQSAYEDLEASRQEIEDLLASFQLLQDEVIKAGRQRVQSERDIERMLETLRQLQEDATSTRRLPVQQQAPPNMKHFWMAVDGGRIYLVDPLPSAERQIGNPFSDQMIVERALDGWGVIPKSDEGMDLRNRPESFAVLGRWLSELPANSYVIQFMLSSDSFVEFNHVKEYLVSQNYRYYISLNEPPYLFVTGIPQKSF